MSKFVVGIVAVLCAVSLSAFAQNKVVFDNQSGDPALVKLIGPTKTEVQVPNGTKAGVDAAAGKYAIKVRYGTPGNYRYSKGQEFEVTETATARSKTTITLHKVIAGNYDAHPISESEFGTTEQARTVAKTPTLAAPTTTGVILYENLAGNSARIPSQQKPIVRVMENPEQLDVAFKVLSLDEVKAQKSLWDGIKPKDDADIVDAVVVFCDYTVASESDFSGLWVAQPFITGLSHFNKHFTGNVSGDRVTSLARQTRDFKSSFSMNETKTGENLGCAVTGRGTITYVWILPSLKTQFKMVFPPHDYSKGKEQTIAVDLTTP